MDAPAIALPTDKRLADKPQRDQRELQAEPVVFEPEKQVRAEDDREGAETEDVVFAPRPRQQHVECVGKEQLAEEKRREIVDGRPVPSPICVDGELTRALDVM